MAEISVQEELSPISKGLSWIMNFHIGPECIVKLRRYRWDVIDILTNAASSRLFQQIISGSMSEGFQFNISDLDIMFLDRHTFVCSESNRVFVQNLRPPSLFSTYNEVCSPGFTLLECLACDWENETVFKSLCRRGDAMYLSSKAVRESFLSTCLSETHGPCQSINWHGKEGDIAYTLKCPVWPKQATSFTVRSIERGWPSYDVLNDVCHDGCLFVPINSKRQTDSELMDLEWRISFSLSEKKIIYSMNHCQFLSYGLTKIFLNEAVKKYSDVKDLLCSYFLKTAVFWEIQECSEDWTIETFLNKFWNVFRRLMKWVRYGYCPNFFIPENNMFYGKICGENQSRLLSVLCDLYSEGYRCLLRCPSIVKVLQKVIEEPILVNNLTFKDEEFVSESEIERLKFLVLILFNSPFSIHGIRSVITMINDTVAINTESEVMLCAVRLRINYIIQRYTESLLLSINPPYRCYTNNRKDYKDNRTMKAAQRILLRSKTYFCMNYLVHAKCSYMAGDYYETIDISQKIIRKFQPKEYMYMWSLDKKLIRSKRQQGMPYDKIVQSFLVSKVEMNRLTIIEELQLESHVLEQYGESGLEVQPLVFAYFLLILSYTRIGAKKGQQKALEELHALLYHDDNNHISASLKAISWEILGICHQICGDRQACLQSYANALNDQYNYFKIATLNRIFCVLN